MQTDTVYNSNIQKNILLKDFTTMRLGGRVSFFAVVHNEHEVRKAVSYAKSSGLPIFPLGSGSNIVVSDKLADMLVIKMENIGISVISENAFSVCIKVLAGTIWDDFVEYTVEHEFSGIEALSAIPGTCGATPVQNVGAYGAEVADTIYSVRYYDIESENFKELKNEECQFEYRDSIFKKSLKGKCIIESVIFTLHKSLPKIPDYLKVPDTLYDIKKSNPEISLNWLIRKTIQKIRSDKLPDPREIASVGSFFKNPFVTKGQMESVLEKFPDIPHFLVGDKYKIPTGWLIERAGLKGFSQNGVGVYEKNALVLVNRSNTKTQELLDFAHFVQKSVNDLFGVSLEIEPEILT